MPDKLHSTAAVEFALPDHHVIEFSGRDAAVFAQAQLMNDVAALQAGQWQWSGWLTPKGRVLAVFAVLKRDDESLWLLLPDRQPASLVDGLRRYVFRSKVAIAVRDDLHVSGTFAAPASARGAQSADVGGVELDFGGDAGPRRLRISGNGDAAGDQAAVARWQLFDIQHGLPRLPDSQVDQWTPQQLSLERLNAFSVRKGCYPGQEIVARTHFLGKAKRGLALLRCETAITAGVDVQGDQAALGKVVASADHDAGHAALAVLALRRPAAGLSIDGQAVRETDLSGGLARRIRVP